MKVYNYDENGYLIGFTELEENDKCPITGDWLIPAMATEKKPLLEKENYKIKFVNNNWEYEKILTDEEKKIQGILPLEEGEKIENGALITVEKLNNYYVWDYNTLSWAYDSSIIKAEIYAELESIDNQTIRPLRAKLVGLATAQDEAKLLELETKANSLRAELKNI